MMMMMMMPDDDISTCDRHSRRPRSRPRPRSAFRQCLEQNVGAELVQAFERKRVSESATHEKEEEEEKDDNNNNNKDDPIGSDPKLWSTIRPNLDRIEQRAYRAFHMLIDTVQLTAGSALAHVGASNESAWEELLRAWLDLHVGSVFDGEQTAGQLDVWTALTRSGTPIVLTVTPAIVTESDDVYDVETPLVTVEPVIDKTMCVNSNTGSKAATRVVSLRINISCDALDHAFLPLTADDRTTVPAREEMGGFPCPDPVYLLSRILDFLSASIFAVYACSRSGMGLKKLKLEDMRRATVQLLHRRFGHDPAYYQYMFPHSQQQQPSQCGPGTHRYGWKLFTYGGWQSIRHQMYLRQHVLVHGMRVRVFHPMTNTSWIGVVYRSATDKMVEITKHGEATVRRVPISLVMDKVANEKEEEEEEQQPQPQPQQRERGGKEHAGFYPPLRVKAPMNLIRPPGQTHISLTATNLPAPPTCLRTSHPSTTFAKTGNTTKAKRVSKKIRTIPFGPGTHDTMGTAVSAATAATAANANLDMKYWREELDQTKHVVTLDHPLPPPVASHYSSLFHMPTRWNGWTDFT